MESISVITPLYNKAPHIIRALNSILKQTKLPGEIIVIDDGSTDGGGDLVEQLQNPLIRLIRQKNKGVSAARNAGISLARGELIALLDADDEWRPRFLEVISEMRQIYHQAGAYATAFDIIDPKGRIAQRSDIKSLSTPRKYYFIENLFSVEEPALLWTSAVVIPRNVLNKVGYFNEGESLAEDVDMWLRIGIHYPIAWANTSLAIYHQDSINRSSKLKKYSHEPAFSISYSNAIKSGIVSPVKMRDFKEFGAFWHYFAARQLILNKNSKLAIKIINKTRGTRRFYRQGWILLILAYLPPIFTEFAIKLYRKLYVNS